MIFCTLSILISAQNAKKTAMYQIDRIALTIPNTYLGICLSTKGLKKNSQLNIDF